MRNVVDKWCGMLLNTDMETNTETTTAPALADLVKVGDFFSCSWGYDQTNVNFYEVVGMTKATLKVRPVASGLVSESGSGITHVAPLAGTDKTHDAFLPVDKASTKRPRIRTSWRGDGEWVVSIHLAEYAWCELWDCQPEYETAIGWGH